MPIRAFLGMIVFLAVLISCTDSGRVSAALGEVPDTVSENLRQVSVSPTGRVEIKSGRVETYADKDLTIFFDAEVKEFDSDGELSLEGRADRIDIEGNLDAEASGGILIHDLSEDTRLEAEGLEWDEEERILTGKGLVRVETGDGFVVEGRGFSADMARESYRYTDGVEGTLEIEDE